MTILEGSGPWSESKAAYRMAAKSDSRDTPLGLGATGCKLVLCTSVNRAIFRRRLIG